MALSVLLDIPSSPPSSSIITPYAHGAPAQSFFCFGLTSFFSTCKKDRTVEPSCHVQLASRNVFRLWLTVLAFTPDCRSWRLDVKSLALALAVPPGRVFRHSHAAKRACTVAYKNARWLPCPPRLNHPFCRWRVRCGGNRCHSILMYSRLHANDVVAAPCRASIPNPRPRAASAAPGAPRPCLAPFAACRVTIDCLHMHNYKLLRGARGCKSFNARYAHAAACARHICIQS